MRKAVVMRPTRMTMAVTRVLILKIDNCLSDPYPLLLFFTTFSLLGLHFAKVINRVYTDTTIAFLKDIVSSILHFTQSEQTNI